jgi:hypothetical protein
MAEIIPTGFAQVTIPFAHATMTRKAAIVYGIKVPVGGVTPEGLATSALLDFTASMSAEIDSEVTMGPAEVSIGQDGGEALAGAGSNTQPGTNPTSSPSPNVAVLLKLRTARGGRRGRGRKYLPWALAEGELAENGVIIAGQVTQLNTAANSWRTTAAAAGRDLVILHSNSSPTNTGPATVPGPPDTVTSISTDSLIATQRRRLGR